MNKNRPVPGDKMKSPQHTSLSKYLYHKAIIGEQLQGPDLNMVIRANNAIESTKSTITQGAANQRDDLRNNKGYGYKVLQYARNTISSTLNKALQRSNTYNNTVKSRAIQAMNAEITRTGNCGEHASLTYFNAIKDNSDMSDMNVERVYKRLDHAYVRMSQDVKETQWKKVETIKDNKKTVSWVEDNKPTTRTITVAADAWTLNRHGQLETDNAFYGKSEDITLSGKASGEDVIGKIKQESGLTTGWINSLRGNAQQTALNSYNEFVQLENKEKLRTGKTNPLKIWNHRQTTNQTFNDKVDKALTERSKLLNSLSNFDINNLKKTQSKYK